MPDSCRVLYAQAPQGHHSRDPNFGEPGSAPANACGSASSGLRVPPSLDFGRARWRNLSRLALPPRSGLGEKIAARKRGYSAQTDVRAEVDQDDRFGIG